MLSVWLVLKKSQRRLKTERSEKLRKHFNWKKRLDRGEWHMEQEDFD